MSLQVEVGLKNAAFTAGLEQMRSQARKFGSDLQTLFVGGPLASLGKVFSVQGILDFADKMREIRNEALRMGTSAESVQRLGKAARSADVEFETLGKAINKATVEASKAAGGSAEGANLFARLRIDAAAFVKMSPEQKLVALAAAFQASKQAGGGNVEMLELLGERGEEIFPLLARGPKALAEGLAEAEVQSNNTVNSLARLSKMVDRLKGAGAKVAAPLAGPAVQYVESYLNVLSTKLQTLKEGIKSMDLGKIMSAQMDLTNPEAIAAQAALGYKKQGDDDAKADAAEEAKAAGANGSEQEVANATKLAALRKSIAEEEARYRTEALSGEARINAIERERAALADKINEKTLAGLEAKKQDLALEHELADLKKSQAGKVQAANEREAELKDRQAMDKMKPGEKLAYMEKKQQAYLDRAQAQANAPAEAAAKRAEAAADKAAGKQAEKLARNERGDGDAARARAEAMAKEADALPLDEKFAKGQEINRALAEADDHDKKADGYHQDSMDARRGADAANDAATKLEGVGPEQAVETRTKAEEMQPEIDALRKALATPAAKDDAPAKKAPSQRDLDAQADKQMKDDHWKPHMSVSADSLQRAGGGGRAYGTTTQDIAKQQRDEHKRLLEQIVKELQQSRKENGRTSEPPEPY